MSLDTLLLELKLMIIEELDIIDKNCLRLTCRSFYRSMQSPNPYNFPFIQADSESSSASSSDPASPPSSRSSSPGYSSAPSEDDREFFALTIRKKEDKLDFLHRLFRPGNIYHGSSNAICGSCVRVCPKGCFEDSNLQFNDRDVCLRCTLLLLSTCLRGGASLTYCGKKYVVCGKCRAIQPARDLYDPIQDGNSIPGGKLRSLCSECLSEERLYQNLGFYSV